MFRYIRRHNGILHVAKSFSGDLLVYDEDGVINLPPVSDFIGFHCGILPHGGTVLLKAPDGRDLINGELGEMELVEQQIRTLIALDTWEVY